MRFKSDRRRNGPGADCSMECALSTGLLGIMKNLFDLLFEDSFPLQGTPFPTVPGPKPSDKVSKHKQVSGKLTTILFRCVLLEQALLGYTWL